MNNLDAKSIKQLSSWLELERHFESSNKLHMRDLFAQDSQRFQRFSIEWNEFLFDYSKNRITKETLSLLLKLAREAEVPIWIEKMFTGERINFTEDRSVLHTVLRNRGNHSIVVNGIDVKNQVNAELQRIRNFCESIHNGAWRGYSGKRITDIVNIGIGGSDLGPAMVSAALRPYKLKEAPILHFVSNVDGVHLSQTIEQINLETTLFIVASKTFTTQETLTNAKTVRELLLKQTRDDLVVSKHFVAISSNITETLNFGIPTNNVFEMWDWVGGRFSVWSSIGLPIALMIGMDQFEEFLDGGYQIDQHFRSAPLEENIPVILALLGIWYINFFNAETHLILPYEQLLQRFPAYIQQADMESNGKGVANNGRMVDYSTGPIVWGEPGTNGQHAYCQLIHQSQRLIPIDFIGSMESVYPIGNHHEILLANLFAQSESLMRGKRLSEVKSELKAHGISGDNLKNLAPHKMFPGNRPTNTILFQKLTPHTLGSLIAIYEHKVFVQGIIWNINSFDQWGVELGKEIAKEIVLEFYEQGKSFKYDSSTNAMINRYKSYREGKRSSASMV